MLGAEIEVLGAGFPQLFLSLLVRHCLPLCTEAKGMYAPLTMTSNYFVGGQNGEKAVLAHSFAHMEAQAASGVQVTQEEARKMKASDCL